MMSRALGNVILASFEWELTMVLSAMSHGTDSLESILFALGAYEAIARLAVAHLQGHDGMPAKPIHSFPAHENQESLFWRFRENPVTATARILPWILIGPSFFCCLVLRNHLEVAAGGSSSRKSRIDWVLECPGLAA